MTNGPVIADNNQIYIFFCIYFECFLFSKSFVFYRAATISHLINGKWKETIREGRDTEEKETDTSEGMIKEKQLDRENMVGK